MEDLLYQTEQARAAILAAPCSRWRLSTSRFNRSCSAWMRSDITASKENRRSRSGSLADASVQATATRVVSTVSQRASNPVGDATFISMSLNSGTLVPSSDIHNPEIAEILFPREKEILPVSSHAAHSSATAAEYGHLALAGSVD